MPCIMFIMCMHVVCLHVKDTYTCMCYTCLSVCLSVCSQVDVSPVTALNLLLELPPNTVNNTQRLPLLTRAFTTAQSNGTANKLLLEVCNNMLKCVICVWNIANVAKFSYYATVPVMLAYLLPVIQIYYRVVFIGYPSDVTVGLCKACFQSAKQCIV